MLRAKDKATKYFNDLYTILARKGLLLPTSVKQKIYMQNTNSWHVFKTNRHILKIVIS